jgi:hypothetical protein
MVTSNYDVDMIYLFRVSWRPGLVVESDGSRMALHRVSNLIDVLNECAFGSLNRCSLESFACA